MHLNLGMHTCAIVGGQDSTELLRVRLDIPPMSQLLTQLCMLAQLPQPLGLYSLVLDLCSESQCALQEQLTAVRTIAEPLRVRLDIPPMSQHLTQLRALEQLPQPLHTAYLQLRAAKEAFGLPADISISGAHLMYLASSSPRYTHASATSSQV